MVLCVAVDRHGWPIAWEIFPGNTADKDAFTHVVTRLRARFRIGRVIVVADRGMISKDTIDLLTKHETAPFDYILGVRMRKDPDAVDLLQMEREFDPIAPGLGVAERTLSGKRYVVCYNEAEAKKDAAAREAIMASLQENLERGETKSLVGNTGYRRFLEGERGSWRIDFQKAIDDELFDGVFVLRTNTDLPAAEVVKTYKGLWRVERTFREQKSTLELRPLFHHNDDTRIGRIVASFLALGLEVDLQRRLDEKIINVSWPTLMRELKNLRVVDLQLGDTRYRLRTDPTPNVSAAFKAIGMHPPPRIREIPADRRAKFSGKTEIAP
jgi:hypothetical protein